MEESEWFRTMGPPGLPCGLDDLRRVASAQCGLVTRPQCLAAGLSTKAIEVRLASGRWRPIQHGIYQTAPGPEDWWSSALAAHLACGPDAAWSHRTAAFVWGLLPTPPTDARGTRASGLRRPSSARNHRPTEPPSRSPCRPALVAVGDHRRGHRERHGTALSPRRREGAWTAPRSVAAPFLTWTAGAPRRRVRRATSVRRAGRPAGTRGFGRARSRWTTRPAERQTRLAHHAGLLARRRGYALRSGRGGRTRAP
jgi:hypothetical protein